MSRRHDRGSNRYLYGEDEGRLLDWVLYPGRRLAAFERNSIPVPDRRRRDVVLSKQVHTVEYRELLWWESTWKPGSTSHRNALFWYEAVLDTRPLSSELPTRTRQWLGARSRTLETHIYQVDKPIPRMDLIRYLKGEDCSRSRN